MNIWLKEIEESDDERYLNLLIELANYKDVKARPVPKEFTPKDFPFFKRARIRMRNNDNLPEGITQTSTYWVMNENIPIGYATLKHKIDYNKPGGHFGLCLKKEYQNKGIGTIVSDLLSDIAYNELGIEEVILTSKKDNIQSQKSVKKIGGELIDEHDDYYFYVLDLNKKYNVKKM